ncbi:MAG: Ig-like domain-containing protein, partial [Bacillota bacterium]
NPGAKVYGKGTYTASWSASEAGSYKVTAVGYKNGSEVTRTSTIYITVKAEEPASISLNSPYSGQIFKVGETVSLSASATGVEYVKFYVGSENPGAKVYGKGTYTASWSASEAGSYKVTAVGYKNGSEVTRTSTIYINVTSKKDTKSPVIFITEPKDNATVTKGDKVKISAKASDNDKVEAMGLYIDDDRKTRPTGDTVSYSWDTSGVSVGSHTIRVTAIDPSGNWDEKFIAVNVQEEQVIKKDTTSPVISITEPKDNATVTKGDKVKISAKASDNDKVEAMGLYIDDDRKTRPTGDTVSYSWDTSGVSVGSHTIRVTAIDPSGNWDEKFITVNVHEKENIKKDTKPPVITITEPKVSAIINKGDKVTITAEASDNDKVEAMGLYIDDDRKTRPTGDTVSYSWDTSGVSVGSHTIRVTAIDPSGNWDEKLITIIVGLDFTVDNPVYKVTYNPKANPGLVELTPIIPEVDKDKFRYSFFIDGDRQNKYKSGLSWDISYTSVGKHTITMIATNKQTGQELISDPKTIEVMYGPTLSYGVINPMYVKVMKSLLAKWKYLTNEEVTEYFDRYTENAVKEFQETNELEPDGIVGDKTWSKLLDSQVVSYNLEDPLVLRPLVNKKCYKRASIKYIQKILLDAKYLSNKKEVDGVFGDVTQAAVNNMRKKNGREETGEIDEEMWDLIASKKYVAADYSPIIVAKQNLEKLGYKDLRNSSGQLDEVWSENFNNALWDFMEKYGLREKYERSNYNAFTLYNWIQQAVDGKIFALSYVIDETIGIMPEYISSNKPTFRPSNEFVQVKVASDYDINTLTRLLGNRFDDPESHYQIGVKVQTLTGKPLEPYRYNEAVNNLSYLYFSLNRDMMPILFDRADVVEKNINNPVLKGIRFSMDLSTNLGSYLEQEWKYTNKLEKDMNLYSYKDLNNIKLYKKIIYDMITSKDYISIMAQKAVSDFRVQSKLILNIDKNLLTAGLDQLSDFKENTIPKLPPEKAVEATALIKDLENSAKFVKTLGKAIDKGGFLVYEILLLSSCTQYNTQLLDNIEVSLQDINDAALKEAFKQIRNEIENKNKANLEEYFYSPEFIQARDNLRTYMVDYVKGKSLTFINPMLGLAESVFSGMVKISGLEENLNKKEEVLAYYNLHIFGQEKFNKALAEIRENHKRGDNSGVPMRKLERASVVYFVAAQSANKKYLELLESEKGLGDAQTYKDEIKYIKNILSKLGGLSKSFLTNFGARVSIIN